jgi:hypothetical protein
MTFSPNWNGTNQKRSATHAVRDFTGGRGVRDDITLKAKVSASGIEAF